MLNGHNIVDEKSFMMKALGDAMKAVPKKKKAKKSVRTEEEKELFRAKFSKENYDTALNLLRITAEGLGYELDSGVRNGDCIVFTCRKSLCQGFLFDDGRIDGTVIKHSCPDDAARKDLGFVHGHELSEEFKARLNKHWKSGK